MLCGVLASSRSRRDHHAVPRLRAMTGAEPVVEGALAVGLCGRAGYALAAGIGCAIEGELRRPAGDPRAGGSAQAGSVARAPADDARAVAAAYRDGPEGLAALRGSFAAVLWDEVRDEFVLTGDPLATRPLYVCDHSSGVFFATEIAELIELLPNRPAPDAHAFVMWLGGGHVPDQRTLYEGIVRLGPGVLLRGRAGALRREVFWQPRYRGTNAAPRAELAEGLRQALEQSTWSRMRPGVNGVVLSGGVDSSIVTAVASCRRSSDVSLRSYSAVFPGFEFDESDKIASLTRQLGIPARTFRPAPQGALWLALRHISAWQLPLAGAGALIEATITGAAAADGAELVLDGQMGDEVLGFAPYLLSDRLARGDLLGAWRLLGRWPFGRPATRQQKLWLLRNVGLKGAVPYRLGTFLRMARRDLEAGAPPWLLAPHRRHFVENEDHWAWKLAGQGPRWWRFNADNLIHAPHREMRLDYLRHRAAAAGIGSSSPLYDVELLEYCLNLPPLIAFDPELSRPLAREAVAGLVPEDVRLQRQKASFSSFCVEMLRDADAAGLEAVITTPDPALGEYLDMAWVRRLWQDGARGQRHPVFWGGVIWKAAVAEAWLRLQSDRAWIERLLADERIPPPALVAEARFDPAITTFFPPRLGDASVKSSFISQPS
jgi:asparagine synthase (glutamine-hydrolysing)